MGCIYELNWILKLPKDQFPNLKNNTEFNFKKGGIRIYPINIPIDLVNENWEAVARCVILSVTMQNGETTGKYRIINVYDENEKAVLSKLWRDTLCYATNDYQIDDFAEKHIT